MSAVPRKSVLSELAHGECVAVVSSQLAYHRRSLVMRHPQSVLLNEESIVYIIDMCIKHIQPRLNCEAIHWNAGLNAA